jgi:hypothetical protein
MTREIGKMKDDLIHLVSFITVTETTNESGRFNDVLANPTLKKSKPSPSWNKFDVNLPMPDLSPAPPGFRYDPTHMDFRNIMKFTGKFNPNSYSLQ